MEELNSESQQPAEFPEVLTGWTILIKQQNKRNWTFGTENLMLCGFFLKIACYQLQHNEL